MKFTAILFKSAPVKMQQLILESNTIVFRRILKDPLKHTVQPNASLCLNHFIALASCSPTGLLNYRTKALISIEYISILGTV